MASDTTQINFKGFWINDFDMTRIGVVVDSVIQRHRAGLSFPDRTTSLPGRVGTIALAREFESTPRRVTVQATQTASSRGQLLTDVMELKRRCYAGTVELSFADDTDRIFLARCDDVDVTLMAPGLPNAGISRHTVRLSFLCQDPLIYDRFGTVASFSTAPGETPLGSAPSLPTVRVFGPSTGSGFTYTYKDAGGTAQAAMTLSGAAAVMSSTESIVFDHELSKITHSDGSNLLSIMSSTSEFFALDPQNAVGSTGPYPTIEIGATGVSGEALFKRAFL